MITHSFLRGWFFGIYDSMEIFSGITMANTLTKWWWVVDKDYQWITTNLFSLWKTNWRGVRTHAAWKSPNSQEYFNMIFNGKHIEALLVDFPASQVWWHRRVTPKNGYFSPSWGGLFHGINGETWDVIGKNEHVISNKHMQTLWFKWQKLGFTPQTRWFHWHVWG